MSRKQERIKLNKVSVSLFGAGSAEWVIDDDQKQAAWEMYVELVTRIAVQPLAAGEGMLREALSSLYSLFPETRRILKTYGPGIAIPVKKDTVAFGHIAIDVLNRDLRPVLAKWHPALLAHEHSRPASVSPLDHERAWPQHDELRRKLIEVQQKMAAYAGLLALACGIEQP